MNLPRPVRVEVDTQGRPTAVSERGEEVPGDGEQNAGSVGRRSADAIVEILEEWRIDDEWWREPIHRRYAEIVLADGAHVVLFEDLTTGAWYAQMP